MIASIEHCKQRVLYIAKKAGEPPARVLWKNHTEKEQTL